MDIADYRREVARIQKRHSVVLGSREDVPTPQKGQAGPLEHPRLGLVGWIAYWSLGNCALAVKIIVGLISNCGRGLSCGDHLSAKTNDFVALLHKLPSSRAKDKRYK